jgi:hypothetical protein
MRNNIIMSVALSTLIGVAFALPMSVLADPAAPGAQTEEKPMVETGTLEVSATQVRLIAGGAKGAGVLHFNGKDYKFKMSGVSVGGIGVTKVDAVGTIYNLYDIKDFPGTYSGMGVGAAAVKGAGASSWENKGVIVQMKSKTEGVALNMGVNAVKIELVE